MHELAQNRSQSTETRTQSLPEIAVEPAPEPYNHLYMQLGSNAQIPDGLIAAMTLLNENRRLGFRASETTLHPGFEQRNSHDRTRG
ncbi:MAG: hypothetical protein JWQ49_5187 [Edaphobacter sp.]|jgi:hypothetical protein|nr:hypothetical protein [Edaphobacter sp.]